MRPLMLLPTVRRLRRDRHTVQVGLDPARALLIELTGQSPTQLLRLLDGTRSEAVIRRETARIGLPDADTCRLLAALRSRGLVVEADTLLPRRLPPAVRRRLEAEAAALALRTGDAGRDPGATPARLLDRRREARVVVRGRSRLAAPIAALLAAAGVGHVHPDAPGQVTATDPMVGGILPADARRPVRRAAADAVLRAAPDTDTRAVDEGDADLLVWVGSPAPLPPATLGRALRRVPHLAVWVRDGTVVVGPLVRPGRSTCLACVEAHRRDRDAHWPALAAQLTTAPDLAEPCAATLVAMGAAVAAEQVLTELDGGTPPCLGGTVEIDHPGVPRRRGWPPHPACGCLDQRRTRTSGRPADRGTMTW
jgi:hypothetical protein